MNGKDFLNLVWPATGFYCIAVPGVNQTTGKKFYKHTIWDTLDDAYLDARGKYQTLDVYFGIFTHLQERVFNQRWQKLAPSRKRENMDSAKCLFLDLDVGTPTKEVPKYKTQGDALAALARFVFRTGLPSPFAVSSGNGVHVYWVLEDPVAMLDWRPHARNLRLLLDEHKVLYDPSRTTDSTSVLRLPGTFNHKGGASDLKKVAILNEGVVSPNDTLFSLLGDLTKGVQPLRASIPVGHAGPLPANISPGTNFAPTDADDVAAECEQIRIFRDSNGNISQPHWYAGLGVIGYCTNGAQVAHKWSSGHPNYTQAETQEKLDQWTAIASVTSCAKLGSDGVPGVCQKCPHFGGQYKNPIVITNKKATPAPTLSFMSTQTQAQVDPLAIQPPVAPNPYVRVQGLGVVRHDSVKQININVIEQYDLYPILLSTGVVAGTRVNSGMSTWVAKEHTQKGIAPTVFQIPNGSLANKDKLHELLVSEGLFFPVTPEVVKYMGAYLKQLKAFTGNRPQHSFLGWKGRDDVSEFVLNGIVIDAKGQTHACTMANEAEIGTEGITKNGTFLKHLDALRFFDDDSYAPHKFMILCSLASPLLMATGHHGVVVNASGESAASKTTTLKAAAGIWGSPTKFIVNGTNRGMSSMARELRAMTLPNLPTCLDEITHMDPEDARTMVMTWPQAELRKTLTSNRTVRENKFTGCRGAYLLSTSNGSLHQNINNNSHVAGTANSARVLQLLFERSFMTHTKEEADTANYEFSTNYGWVGEVFMQLTMPSMPLLFDSVRRMVAKIDRDTNAAPVHRFLSAAAAPAFVAGALAVYHGLIDWDIDALYDWFVNTQWPLLVGDMAEQQGYVDHERVLRDFLSQHTMDTLVDHGAGNIEPASPRTHLVAHKRVDLKEIWVSIADFRAWCMRRGTPMTDLIKSLQQEGVITNVNTRKVIGEGTRFAGPRNNVFIVDVDALNK